MTALLPFEVVIAGMTILITFDLNEALDKCRDLPGAHLRTALSQ